MLIQDLSYFDTLSQSSSVGGGQAPTQENAGFTFLIGEDNTISLFQGKNKLFSKKLTSKPAAITFSVAGNFPSITISGSAMSFNGASTSVLSVGLANHQASFDRIISQL